MLRTAQSSNDINEIYDNSREQDPRTQPISNRVSKRPRPESEPETLSPASNCKRMAIKTKHLYNTVCALKHIAQMRPLPMEDIKDKEVTLEPKVRGGKTVIFDLDETLVHCVMDPNKAEVQIPIQLPTGESTVIGFNIRPYAYECLQAASKLHEVIVWTASTNHYADTILNYLDPTGSLIHHRLYRSSCIRTHGVYVKDLRILNNRRLENIVIIDNSAFSFAYQIDNGVPIIEWIDDRNDRELYNLIGYMHVIAKESDVREINRKAFKLDSFKST